MPDYSKGIIYKIKHNEDYDDENIYIGSTCGIIKRRCHHKTCCNNQNNPKYNKPLYKYIRENGGWDAFILIKIHDYKCNSKNELKVEERRMIDMLKPKLNKCIPTRSQKEWYEDNKEVILEKNKKYREANKEVIAEKKKEKCKCDICGAEVRKDVLERHKTSKKCLSVKNNLCTN